MMAHYLQAASNTDGTSSSSQTQNFNFLKRKLSGKLGFDDEGCSSKKNKDDSPAIGVPLIRLPESNFCPLCNTQTTRENWARHCHGRHKDFLENDQLVVREAEVRSFIFNCMEKLNFSAYHIFQFVTNMDFADKYGFYSHGLTNFGSFVTNLYEKNLVTSGATSILKEKGSTAYINGENMLGVVVANYCTDKAIVLARTYGTGMVVAKNSNNFGCGQYFIKNMARYGMEGFICSSDSSSLYVTTNNRLYEIPRTKITSEFITLLSLFAGDRLGDDLQGKSNDTFELSVEGEKEYEKKLSVLGGFRYSQDVLNNIINLAADFGVPNLNVV
uniref:ANF_receptor domain-containing protein n=1 Tax=Meloidogyne hapla TaxID=6305 RepID=A0A1I8C0W8_MELHA